MIIGELNEKGQYQKPNTLIFKNRTLSGRSTNKSHSKLSMVFELFDLIADGLVEKVDD